jgi:adenylate cyclase
MATTDRPTQVTGRVAGVTGRLVRVPGLGPRASALAVAVTTRIVVANAVAAFFVAAYLTLTEHREPGEGWREAIAANAIFYVVAVVLFSLASVVRGRRLFTASWRWLDDASEPTPEQRRELLRQPLRIGLFPLRYWVAAAVASVVVRVVIGSSVAQIVVAAVAVLEGGLVAAALGLFLGERALRRAFAVALAGTAPETPVSLGVGTRLFVAFALGAGVPLLGIVLTPFVVPDSDLDPQWAMVFLGAVGLLSGFVMMGVAARSIVQPIARVRAALARVGAGDLATAVVVDDPGELGQLEAGVNEMVAGLRERARLEDLFGRHVGEPVVRRALEHGAQLGGELRTVSALFVDLKESTELSRRLAPQEVVTLLNHFFAAVVAACDAEGGWLSGYAGDGALCVFGAPNDQPDHATRALRAARAMATALADLRRDRPDLDAGIGVATGRVVAGHVGTETRLEYTVVGWPVNVAARLTVAAKARPGRALADRSAVESAEPGERSRWVPDEPVDLKGLEPGLAVFAPAP